MTREEAIKIIDCYDIGFYDLSGEKIPADKLAEAFDMAIEALSADAVQGEWIVREYCTNELDYRRWIEIECPFCGERPTYENLDNMNYCPNCGAIMKGGAE